MQLISGTTDFALEYETAVAIGKFDGVHVGHRQLLKEILAQKSLGLKSCVFTFDPPPAVLFGASDGKVLTTREEKRIVFEQMGIDVLVEFPLTEKTAGIPAEDFVREYLRERLNAKVVVAGTDLSFGAGGRGNTELLCEMAQTLDMEVKTIQKVCIDDKEVSSTLVRELVEKGESKEWERFLGMPYPIMGTVVSGNRVGRKIGFPTVNIRPEPEKLLPPKGVYRAEIISRGRKFSGISNVGYKPTVTEEKELVVETYLYDFEEDIYGETIEIYLKEFLRAEKKFDNLEALKGQIARDIQVGKMEEKHL